MKAFQLTLDEQLVDQVDKTAKQLGKTRSSFTRFALKLALDKVHIQQLENKHRKGYRVNPVQKDEFLQIENDDLWQNL